MTSNKTLPALLMTAILSASATPAAASDGAGTRAATAVGHWIAMQGNEALRDIREQFRERLLESLKPLVPAPAPAAAPAATAPAQR